MNILKLKKEIKKNYFNYQDIANILNISQNSARVTASRYAEKGYLLRIKKGIYVFEDNWKRYDTETKFTFANMIQTPSYISLMSALSYYQISTQIQQDFIESVSQKRSKTVDIQDTVFNFTKINTTLYCGFTRKEGFFIAEAEKAFLDALYLVSLGRYRFDFSSIDFDKLDRKEIEKLLGIFPDFVKKKALLYGFI
jgi:predicted transcriptional regulator of viral defense system